MIIKKLLKLIIGKLDVVGMDWIHVAQDRDQ
jgi:hypothetical protein